MRVLGIELLYLGLVHALTEWLSGWMAGYRRRNVVELNDELFVSRRLHVMVIQRASCVWSVVHASVHCPNVMSCHVTTYNITCPYSTDLAGRTGQYVVQLRAVFTLRSHMLNRTAAAAVIGW